MLYPAPIRDIIIELGNKGLFQAKWTEQIHEEWIGNLLKNRSDLSRKKLERTRDFMNKALPDCLIRCYEELIDTIVLPDPNDRHVVAAAIQCNAQVIITSNIKDFPENILQQHDILAVHPDDFFLDQLDLDRPAFLHSIREIRKRLKNPPLGQEEYLFALQKSGLFKIVKELESYAEFF